MRWLGGRVRTSITSSWQIAVTSVPYPFRLQRAKSSLESASQNRFARGVDDRNPLYTGYRRDTLGEPRTELVGELQGSRAKLHEYSPGPELLLWKLGVRYDNPEGLTINPPGEHGDLEFL